MVTTMKQVTETQSKSINVRYLATPPSLRIDFIRKMRRDIQELARRIEPVRN